MTSVGERIQELRKKQKLTQHQLGKLINVTNTTISNYETKVSEPELATLIKLAKLFNVSTDYLLNFKSEEIQTIDIPIIKTICDEKKILLKENIMDYIKIPQSECCGKPSFIVKIMDNKLSCIGVRSNDMIIVSLANEIPNGKCGLFLSPDNTWFLSHYYQTGGYVTLIPNMNSSNHRPILFDKKSGIKKIGLLTGIVKRNL